MPKTLILRAKMHMTQTYIEHFDFILNWQNNLLTHLRLSVRTIDLVAI
jgi:hypothetical protein